MPNADGPSVGVVIATHNRPELMRRALDSVLQQDCDRDVEVAIVFDQSAPDNDVARSDPHRKVITMTNQRTPGLAGARNTGILSLSTDILAFCDDDDIWLPGKLSAQIERLLADPDSEFVTTAMRVDVGGRSAVRLARQDRVTVNDLTRSRMSMLHASSFLFWRAAMLGDDGFGLVDETMPRSMGEDWDLLLRAARQRPIEHIDEPLVGIQWGEKSYFNDAWADKNAAHRWLIDHHPEIRKDRVALGLMLSKLAFGHAALGNRTQALRLVQQAVRVNWREPRTPIALLVVAGVPAHSIITQLNKRGHGI